MKRVLERKERLTDRSLAWPRPAWRPQGFSFPHVASETGPEATDQMTEQQRASHTKGGPRGVCWARRAELPFTVCRGRRGEPPLKPPTVRTWTWYLTPHRGTRGQRRRACLTSSLSG